MKKITLSIIAISSLLSATEFRYGTGTFTMNGGMIGLTNSIDADINSYSLATRHSNIAGSEFFYGYDFTWMDSKDLQQAQKSYNSTASEANRGGIGFLNNPIGGETLSIPSMEYRIKGLDANVNLGYDIIHKGEGDFFGASILVGLSVPWIEDSRSDKENSTSNNDNSLIGMYEDSKTKILTYKIGPAINFQKTLISDKLSLYGTAAYAYQTGDIKNDYAKSDLSVNGTYQEYNIGLHYTPFTKNYDLGWFTLSPRIYATLGYKYSKWNVDDVLINLSGQEFNSNITEPLKSDFSMESSIGYFGVGYSF